MGFVSADAGGAPYLVYFIDFCYLSGVGEVWRAMAATAASLALSSPIRYTSRCASRFLVLCSLARTSRKFGQDGRLLSEPSRLITREIPRPSISYQRLLKFRQLCSSTLAAETEEGVASVDNVRKFRKRQTIGEIKGGPEEGLEFVGQKLVVRGWVRTCRVQRSVTFIEVGSRSIILI